jgi:hypothetical protein
LVKEGWPKEDWPELLEVALMKTARLKELTPPE